MHATTDRAMSALLARYISGWLGYIVAMGGIGVSTVWSTRGCRVDNTLAHRNDRAFAATRPTEIDMCTRTNNQMMSYSRLSRLSRGLSLSSSAARGELCEQERQEGLVKRLNGWTQEEQTGNEVSDNPDQRKKLLGHFRLAWKR